MAKYSCEFKKEIITAYLNGNGSYEHLAKKYNTPNKSAIRLWVNNYKAFGEDSFMRSRRQQKYFFEKSFM